MRSNIKIQNNKQLQFLKKQPLAYGGELLKTRKGREGGRTLDTKNSMHLVLRSSKAVGDFSFSKEINKRKVANLFRKFGIKYGVKLQSVAYAGNHIHCQIRLSSRHAYKPFIRALTSAIAMAITSCNRWTKKTKDKLKFWDYRPFTRVVKGYRALLTLKDYLQINRLEGYGYNRSQARFLIEWNREPQDRGGRAPLLI
jgi:putative transposase